MTASLAAAVAASFVAISASGQATFPPASSASVTHAFLAGLFTTELHEHKNAASQAGEENLKIKNFIGTKSKASTYSGMKDQRRLFMTFWILAFNGVTTAFVVHP